MNTNSSVKRNIMPRLEEIQEIVMKVLKDKDIPLDTFKVIDNMIKDYIPNSCSPELKAIYYVGYMNGCKATILEASKDLKAIQEDLSLKDVYPIDTSLN